MVSKEAVVASNAGLHARPATELVKKASSFKSQIQLEYKGVKAEGKSLIGVLSLGASKGVKVKVTANGEDEQKAVDELVKVIQTAH